MKLERSAWSDYQRAAAREWLVTNGLGGYAAGTIAGSLTRSYHGLLIIPFQPPLDRRLLVAKADETVLRGSEEFPLYSNHWSGGVVEHAGLEHLEGFQLVDTTPVWTYQAAGARIQKRIWMEPGAQTTYLRYDSDPGGAEISIRIRLLVNWRNHHQVARGRARTFQVEQADQGVRFFPAGEGPSPCLLAPGADFQPAGTWHRDFFLARERERGLDHREDHYHLGSFQASLPPDSSLSLVFSTEPDPDLDGTSAYQRRREYEQRLLGKAGAVPEREEFWQLTLAADQFLVSRSLPDQPEGKTILAGYPWFGDWGRDTMISLPGLTLSTGRSTQARRIL